MACFLHTASACRSPWTHWVHGLLFLFQMDFFPMSALRTTSLVAACLLGLAGCASQPAATPSPAPAVPQGAIKGTVTQHTPQSLQAAISKAWVSLPASVTGGAPYHGLYSDAPAARSRAPVMVFVHGSGGINPMIKEFQKWAAESLGIASITADSMQLKDRITYKSPIPKADYEVVHALRAAELQATIAALPAMAFADSTRMVIAGTSEGAVAVARYQAAASAPQEKGRLILSWSCEDNYHVQSHQTQLPTTLPVLNVVSSTDIYFSRINSWLGNPSALGHCGEALKENKVSSIVMISGAPHTLFNLPQARQPIEGFLKAVLK